MSKWVVYALIFMAGVVFSNTVKGLVGKRG